MICKPFVYRPATARTEITYDNCEIPLSRPTSSSNYLELRFRCWTSLTLTFFYSTFTYVFFNYCHVLYVFKNIFERFFSCMIHRALRSGRAPAAWTELSSRVNARRTELASHCARSHRYLARSSSAGLHGTSCHRRLVTPWHILSLVIGDSMAHPVACHWWLHGTSCPWHILSLVLGDSMAHPVHGTSWRSSLVTPWHILSLVTGDSMAHPVHGTSWRSSLVTPWHILSMAHPVAGHWWLHGTSCHWSLVTPWHILSLVIGFCSGTESCGVPAALYDLSYWLCYLNSPINPFCYALANEQFKKAFLRILRLDWQRGWLTQTQVSTVSRERLAPQFSEKTARCSL